MKKLLIATTLAFAATAANASTIGLAGAGVTPTFTAPFNPSGFPFTFTSGLTGTLTTSTGGILAATFIGKEAGFTNKFTLNINGSTLTNTQAAGTTITANVGTGAVDYKFFDNHGGVINNGQANTAIIGIAYFLDPTKTYDYLLGFNDSFAGSFDFDDMLVGVKFTATPLPAALPLLGSAIGVFGLARRNKKVTLA